MLLHAYVQGDKACYLNKEELTAERYPLIPEHLVPGAAARGERMFRTGDGGRFLPDGQVLPPPFLLHPNAPPLVENVNTRADG